MAFLTSGTASATVTATQPIRMMRIDQERLRTLLLIDSQIAAVMHRLLGADLARKLRVRNEAA
jgi:CRP-like cAMP-binding protein